MVTMVAVPKLIQWCRIVIQVLSQTDPFTIIFIFKHEIVIPKSVMIQFSNLAETDHRGEGLSSIISFKAEMASMYNQTNLCK